MPSLRVKEPLDQSEELGVWMNSSSIRWQTSLNWQLSWRFPTNCENLKQAVIIKLRDTRLQLEKVLENGRINNRQGNSMALSRTAVTHYLSSLIFS